MPNPIFEVATETGFDVNAASVSDVVNVSGFRDVIFQASSDTGTFASAVLVGQCSADGLEFYDIPGSSITGPAISAELHIGAEYFRVRVSTQEGSAGTVTLTVNMKR